MSERFRKNFIAWNVLWLAALAMGGCRTLSAARASSAENRQAMTSIAGGLAGRPLSEDEARQLEEQLKTDPQAQAALRGIASSMSEQARAKYCPVGGEHYAPHLESCPVHNVKLKMVGE